MKILLFTSGKVEPKNTSHGGWSVVMLATDDNGDNIGTKVLSGYEYGETPYQVQAIAISEGLRALTCSHDSVVIYGRNETLIKTVMGQYKASQHGELITAIQGMMQTHKQAECIVVTKDTIEDYPLQMEADKLAVKACYEGAKSWQESP